MANKPLKTITFPGLSDTYTVPQLDTTLAVSGKAADAKATGDAINDLRADLSDINLCTKIPRNGDFDAAIADPDGYVLCEFANGHIKTKNFDSSTTGSVNAKSVIDESDTLYVADADGNVIAEYNNGYWRSKRLLGKKISILGDSISTFNGFSPSGWNPYYPSAESGVSSLNQMWFEIAAKCLGATVLTSASWGGSQVSGNSQGSTGEAMCSTVRINALTKNGIEPDIIVIFGGTNDWYADKTLGSFDFASELPAEGTINVFSDAYGLMMHKIMTKYPQSEIYCCTVCQRTTRFDVSFPIKNNNNNTLAEFNDEIRKIAKMFGANIIDFDQCGMTIYNTATYTVDNLHPNSEGQKLLADEAIRDMLR